jgi:hypothetical protein
MRTPAKAGPALAALGVAALGLAVAGCTTGTTATGPTPSISGSASTTGTPVSPGPIASCVVGDWRTTSASGQASAGSAVAQISGGGGAAFKVGPNGDTTVDFAGMQPTTFTVTVSGTEVSGSFSYGGTAAGTIQTSGGEAATSGSWEPVGTVDWDDMRLTVNLTKPVQAQVLNNARIGDYVGDNANQSGNVVDVDPLLGKGTFECQGDTLVLAPDSDSGITWTLARS